MKRFALLTLLLFTLGGAAQAQPRLGGPTAPDGKTVVQVDLPVPLRLFNSGGNDRSRGNPRGEPGKGYGLCVFTATFMSAMQSGDARFLGFQEKMKHEPGGGDPAKLTQMVAKYAGGAPLLQYEGGDPSLIRLALANGLMPCVTWAGINDPHYADAGGPIAHMVNSVAYTDSAVCLLDNNAPYNRETKADDQLVWMTPAEFRRGWTHWGNGWCAVVLGKGPPPPVPTNHLAGGQARAWHAPRYEWWTDARFPGDLFLRSGGELLGGWTRQYDPDGAYYPKAGGRWLPAAEPPVPVPGAAPASGTARVQAVVDYGCPQRRRRPGPGGGAGRYTLNGKVIDRAAAEQLVTKGAGLPFLTVVGDDAFRARALADLAGPLRFWAKRLIVQDYPPGHPMVAASGHAPGITLQPAPGAGGAAKVLFRLRGYPGAERLAGYLRQKAPNYDPAKDPDPMAPPPAPPKPAPGVQAGALEVVVPAALALVFVAVVLLPARRQAAAAPAPPARHFV